MILLKYLEYEPELASQTLEMWLPPTIKRPEYYHGFRASSNAIYPFYIDNKKYFLRISPEAEKIEENLYGEIEFLQYLHKNTYPSIHPLKSLQGNFIEKIEHKNEAYYASVFNAATGNAIEDTELTEQVIYSYGQALANLHNLSTQYKPMHPKWSYENVMIWIYNTLNAFSNQSAALKEYNNISKKFAALEKNNETFGLVHYDFEVDNVFYDKSKNHCSVIDFEDSMYHWFGIDAEQALDSLYAISDTSLHSWEKQIFLNGYSSKRNVSYLMLEQTPLFRRFIDLYSYTRILRVTQEVYKKEPTWMIELRKKLQRKLISLYKQF